MVNMGKRERIVSVGREDQVGHLRIEKSKRRSQEKDLEHPRQGKAVC